MLNALNEVLRDDFIKDSVGRHRALEPRHREGGRRRSASPCRTRRSTARSARSPNARVSPDGRVVERSGVGGARARWLPTPEDRAFVASLMGRVDGAGQVRELDRAAGDGHQQAAGRLRIRALRHERREAPSCVREVLRQHLIDPEICIRCNTCEETCPIDAITHDARNYVVDPAICNALQRLHLALPDRRDRQLAAGRARPARTRSTSSSAGTRCRRKRTSRDRRRRHSAGHRARSRPRRAPARAALRPRRGRPRSPYVNLHTLAKPAVATVTGNHPLTGDGASQRHPPHRARLRRHRVSGARRPDDRHRAARHRRQGRPHYVRLYSVASPRDGERPRYNNVALTVKRVTEDHDGNAGRGVASNYLCDLDKGATVKVIGPFGASFLMPNHPGSSLLMICTGTGSAPMRAMTERRRRRIAHKRRRRRSCCSSARAPRRSCPTSGR